MDLYPPKRTIRTALALMAIILVSGLGIGLLLSRGIKPPRALNTNVAGLEHSSQEQYTVLVGAGYALDGDIDGATAKLERLEVPNISLWVANLLDRYVAEGHDVADIHALSALAHGLGIQSPPVVAYLATMTPRPTRTPIPTTTPAPTGTLAPTNPPTPTSTPAPATATDAPSATPPTQPTDTLPPPTDTPPPPTDTPIPQPTNTPRPQPTNPPAPTNTPAVKWTYTAQLDSPIFDGQDCSYPSKLIQVTVMDAGGRPLSGVWVYEKYSNQYLPSGHKGDDPFWGPGDVELSELNGGQICIATGDGGACESAFTRDLPCHDPPPFEDLWAAGYCECCETGITKERCRELFDAGSCLTTSHYAWRVEFKRSW